MGVTVVAAVFVAATAVFVAAITVFEGVGDDGPFDGVELIDRSAGSRVFVSFGSEQAMQIHPKSMNSGNSKR